MKQDTFLFSKSILSWTDFQLARELLFCSRAKFRAAALAVVQAPVLAHLTVCLQMGPRPKVEVGGMSISPIRESIAVLMF